MDDSNATAIGVTGAPLSARELRLGKRVRSDETRMVPWLPLIFRLTTGTFGRGYGPAMRLIGKVMGDAKAVAEFDDGSLYYFIARDTYWNRLALPDFAYEMEIFYFLRKIADLDYVFVDAGANLGFWSVLASSRLLGSKRAIAIEASTDTYDHLVANREANANRFVTLHNAIYCEDGQVLSFSTGSHAGRHISSDFDGDTQSVVSIKLDSIIKQFGLESTQLFVVKLDVEGAEAEALDGARNLMTKNFVIIYEDHGKDTRHEITKHLMQAHNCEIYYISPEFSIDRICDVARLDEIKVNRRHGYNFFACKPKSLISERLKRDAG